MSTSIPSFFYSLFNVPSVSKLKQQKSPSTIFYYFQFIQRSRAKVSHHWRQRSSAYPWCNLKPFYFSIQPSHEMKVEEHFQILFFIAAYTRYRKKKRRKRKFIRKSSKLALLTRRCR